jgi:hypothetical protein
MTKGKDLQIPGLQKEIPSRSSPFTWSVCTKNEKEREKKTWARVSMAENQILNLNLSNLV